MDLTTVARDEVVGLHDFFVGWFTGTLDDTEPVFERFAGAMHPEFSMVVPSGEVLDRNAVVASLRSAHGSADGSFAIEIREVVDRFSGADGIVLTYEEWQFFGDRVDSRRVSTVFLVRASGTTDGVQWRHLHETLLPADGEGPVEL